MAAVEKRGPAENLLSGTLQGIPRRIVTWLMMAVLGRLLPIRVIDAHLIPLEGPLLVVSNHLSNADPPLLAFAFPRPLFYMGKSELFRNRVLAWILRRFGGFPVERGTPDRAALRHAIAVLNQGIAMGIFPEAGRSKTFALGRGLPGAGLLALQSRALVLPVAIYGTEFYPVNGDMPPRRPCDIPRGVTIRFGHPFEVPERVDGRRVIAEEATRLMMLHIAELLPDHYRGYYANG